MSTSSSMTRIMAGIPALNASLYRRIRFLVGDPVVLIEVPLAGKYRSTLILRDIEMDRAREHAAVDNVSCPMEYEPISGLSGDRETATAQSMVEFLRRSSISKVVADRTLPMIFCEIARQAGIDVQCDIEFGVLARRQKDAQELEWIQQAQTDTEKVMQRACETVLAATAAPDGSLSTVDGPLTSEWLRTQIDVWLLELGYTNPGAIVAGGSEGADCHNLGKGVLRTEQPVIVDIFPRNKQTLYNGDCTRTVVHGNIPDPIAKMHAAVVLAKQAATAVVKAGVTGQAVHAETTKSMVASGYAMGMPPSQSGRDFATMPHGTGHGLGLEVHEPPLLDRGGPALLVGDVITIEPGLYCEAYGGVRVEDMVAVQQNGCINFNRLPEGLKLN